ncbi:hypothetical protein CWI37_0593p0010 [Hamiltosporidium tvaerminnensis]|uniref:Uncharacterized protein n=1 Tax=Hamiltosporidium tvaerminnensis TaxID=1176355 RepID=A0A4Q9L535_9MICR|nr:hypothetical protein CWI37_0593p0010 [Hamiltosporidium tvaerminnensis]
MYYRKRYHVLNNALSKKKPKEIYSSFKSRVKYEINVPTSIYFFLIFPFLGKNTCIRVIVDFETSNSSSNSSLRPDCCFSFFDPYSIKMMYFSESIATKSNHCSYSQTLNTNQSVMQQEESCECIKKQKLDLENAQPCYKSDYTTENAHIKDIHYPECNINEKYRESSSLQNITNEDNGMMNTEDRGTILINQRKKLVIFDYLDTFMIRSKYLDELSMSENEELKLNINDITKSHIDSEIFEECMNTLQYGWCSIFYDLKKEQFLSLIRLLYDLDCYSDSNALFIFYENLLPFIFSYLADRSCINISNLTGVDFKSNTKYFLPFIYVLYDSIEINFNTNNKELTLIEREQDIKKITYEKHNIFEIIIRTTPRALDIIYDENSKDKWVFLNCIICSFKIEGIRISSNDMYFSECKNIDLKCESILHNSKIYEMNTAFISVFTTIELMKRSEIKSIEFEKVVLSDLDVLFLISLINIESLSIVKCTMTRSTFHFRKLARYFPKLKILRIVGFELQYGFFNRLPLTNIEVLDISCSRYIGNLNHLKSERMNSLIELGISYTYLNYKILNFLMLSNNLKVLTMRGVDSLRLRHFNECDNWQRSFQYLDLSRGKLHDFFLTFFSMNIKAEVLFLENLNRTGHLKKILEQKSLYESTKKLSLSGCFISEDLIDYICEFKFLEHLYLFCLKQEFLDLSFFKCKFISILVVLNLSKNELKKETLDSLKHFDRLETLNLSDCSLKPEFMSYLCVPSLIASVAKLKLSGNIFCASDIFKIGFFINLVYLSITLDNKVFADYLTEYRVLRCMNLEKLVLVTTDLNIDIKNLILSLPSLRSVKLIRCTIEHNLATLNCNCSPSFFKDTILKNI